MKRVTTGASIPVPAEDCSDWERVKAMRDSDILYDEDSPFTTAAHWEGAVMPLGHGCRNGREAPAAQPLTDDSLRWSDAFGCQLIGGDSDAFAGDGHAVSLLVVACCMYYDTFTIYSSITQHCRRCDCSKTPCRLSTA